MLLPYEIILFIKFKVNRSGKNMRVESGSRKIMGGGGGGA